MEQELKKFRKIFLGAFMVGLSIWVSELMDPNNPLYLNIILFVAFGINLIWGAWTIFSNCVDGDDGIPTTYKVTGLGWVTEEKTTNGYKYSLNVDGVRRIHVSKEKLDEDELKALHFQWRAV